MLKHTFWLVQEVLFDWRHGKYFHSYEVGYRLFPCLGWIPRILRSILWILRNRRIFEDFSIYALMNKQIHEQDKFIIMISELLKLSFLNSRLIIFVKKLEDAFNIKETPKCDEKWKNQMPTTHHIQYHPWKRKWLEIYHGISDKIIGLSKSDCKHLYQRHSICTWP